MEQGGRLSRLWRKSKVSSVGPENGGSTRQATPLPRDVSTQRSTLPHRPSSTGIVQLQPKPVVILTKSEQLWSEAYRIVTNREPDLVKNYEENLSLDNTPFSSPKQIQDAVKTSLDDREARQIIITLAGRPIKIREYGEKLVKFTIRSKDLISSAVSTEPHAALAWAGISLLLPIVLGPSQESNAMLKGLDFVSNLIQLYRIRETLYLQTSDHTEFEETVIQLYSYIFEYQARMLCHLSRKPMTRAFQNVIKAGQWDELLRTARECDSKCLSYSNLVDLKLEREQWDQQLLQMDRSHHIQERIVDELKKIRLQREAERDDDFHREFFHAFSSRYSEDKDFNTRRVPHTCQWFLENTKFCDWRDSESSRILWISASPGCGKSVLSKCLVDEKLVSRRAMTSTVCYFFFKDGHKGRQNGADALTAILHQIYSSNLQSSLVNHALDKFKKFKDLQWMFGELWNILMETAKDPTAGEIVCVIDALDECEQHARKQFLDELIDFYSRRALGEENGVRLKFRITSRPYDSIQSRLNQLLNEISYIHFDADENYDPISQDINKVIDYRLPRILGSKFNQDEQKEIVNHLKATGNRTYLWLSLVLDVMRIKVTTHRTGKKMRDLISELPSSVSAAYEQILNRSSDARLARIIVQIVLASRRPLTVPEMNVALEIASDNACTSYKDLDLSSDDAFKFSIREICGLFVTIHDSQVYLIHQTAREFLLTKPEVSETESTSLATTLRWEHTINTVNAETLMARVCMSLLQFKEFSVLPKWGNDIETAWYKWGDKYNDEVELFVLLEYASHYWVQHYAKIQKAPDQALQKQALMLSDSERTFFHTWYPIFCTNSWSEIVFGQDKITVLSELGLHVLIEKLLKESQSVDASNTDLNLGLLKASAGGHEMVVRMLLDAGADVNAVGGDYGSALQAASFGGHETVVRMLLDVGADINTEGGDYDSAIQAASFGGRETVVRILLDAGADINTKGGDYGSVLQAASFGGHETVVRMLLDAGADVSTIGGLYGNALQAASARGHETVVQILLDAGADVNTKGGHYGSALQAASREGHETVVRMLLDAGADVRVEGDI